MSLILPLLMISSSSFFYSSGHLSSAPTSAPSSSYLSPSSSLMYSPGSRLMLIFSFPSSTRLEYPQSLSLLSLVSKSLISASRFSLSQSNSFYSLAFLCFTLLLLALNSLVSNLLFLVSMCTALSSTRPPSSSATRSSPWLWYLSGQLSSLFHAVLFLHDDIDMVHVHYFVFSLQLQLRNTVSGNLHPSLFSNECSHLARFTYPSSSSSSAHSTALTVSPTPVIISLTLLACCPLHSG